MRPEWKPGEAVGDTVMFSVKDVIVGRGFPDDYEDFMRKYEDSDDFMFKCLGNAVSQSFMSVIDEEVHRTLTMAGVTHDITEENR